MTTPHASQEALAALLQARLADSPAAAWLSDHGQPGGDAAALASTLRGLRGALGRRSLVAAFQERAGASLEVPHGALPLGDWRVDEAARALLVARCAEASGDPGETLFTLYDQGDADTRVAALRALNLVALADPEPGLRMVLDAGRTNDTQLMAAAWCNPWSAKHLSDHDHRKAVLKAFFTGVPVEGFPGLLERADPELAQSLCEFIDERLAAGRTVAPSIWAVAALYPRPGLVARLIGHLEHPNPEERLAAARALENARDPRAASFLAERLEREQVQQVHAALARALAASQEGGR